MRPFKSTISLDEALAILRDAALPTSRTESVPLDRAAGRVVARRVIAEADVPPFDRAAMDGYAVRAADTQGASAERPVPLRTVATVFTGETRGVTVGAGEAVVISTGAPIPVGADAVVMVEHTSAAGPDLVHVNAAAAAGQHIGRRGADMSSGETVLEEGTVLTPARVGALAALGRTDVESYARPRVFVASTGNEIVPPGVSLAPGQIHDINRFTLAPVIRGHGGDVAIGSTVEDTIVALGAALDAALEGNADLVVLSGGSSVGTRDLLVDAVRERGEVLFHGLAVKPGKPTLLARLGRTLLLLGMPGNPTSCLSNAYILLVPLLRRLAHLPPWEPFVLEAPLARDVYNTARRHTFFTVRLESGRAVPAFKGSGEITSLAHADGYFEIPADVVHVPAGALVRVTLF
jgi:molybdenum cofactor synthesis domain-containing protein